MVASGVAIGTVVGVMKILYNIPLLLVIVPLYALNLKLSYLQDDVLVGVAWDAAGVTTGSITVPLILALGLGIGEEIGALKEGFLGPLGILACASAFPICFVLTAFRGVMRRRSGNSERLSYHLEQVDEGSVSPNASPLLNM